MKETVCAGIGVIGGIFATVFGGWDGAIVTLLILMGIDYVTGLMVAGVFHTSRKSASGALESRAGWKGLCRKGVTLLVVLAAYRLDVLAGTAYVRDAVIIGFSANELLSITENAGLMGLPLPGALAKAIDVLGRKEDDDE